MTKVHIPDILEMTVKMTSLHGTEGVSIRHVAHEMALPPSLLCYHFNTKAELLNAMCGYASDVLHIKRKKLSLTPPLSELLKQRILFQFEQAHYIMAILKYFMGNKDQFHRHDDGYLPNSAYRHIEEILMIAQSRNEISLTDIQQQAKIITHTINGFVMEYYPEKLKPTELDKITSLLVPSLMKMLQN